MKTSGTIPSARKLSRVARSASGGARKGSSPGLLPRGDADARARLGQELLGVCASGLKSFRADAGPNVTAGLRAFGRTATYARQLLADAGSAAMLHTRWQREADYVDEEGQPRIIAVRGKAPSFEALCRQCHLGRQSERLLALACQFRLCSRVGPHRLAYHCDVLLMTGHPTLMLARAVTTIERFLRTCAYNARPGRKVSASLGDRTTEVDLSPEEFARLSKATRRFLSSFIESTDRQLLAGVARDNRNRRSPRSRRRSGVTAFVFRD